MLAQAEFTTESSCLKLSLNLKVFYTMVTLERISGIILLLYTGYRSVLSKKTFEPGALNDSSYHCYHETFGFNVIHTGR